MRDNTPYRHVKKDVLSWISGPMYFMLKPELVAYLHQMMMDPEAEYAETILAKGYMPFYTAKKLQRHLFEDTEKWYHSVKHKASVSVDTSCAFQPTNLERDRNLERKVEGLGRSPKQIPDRYWDTLEKYGLVTTVDIEQTRRFQLPASVEPPTTDTGREIFRLLEASITVCSQTSKAIIQTVAAGSLAIKAQFLETGIIKVHENAWNLLAYAEEFNLSPRANGSYFIISVVNNLFSDIIGDVPDRMLQSAEHPAGWHRVRAQSLVGLNLMGYMDVKGHLTLKSCGEGSRKLRVEWSGQHSLPADTQLVVQLHQDWPTCSEVKHIFTIAKCKPEHSPRCTFEANSPQYRRLSCPTPEETLIPGRPSKVRLKTATWAASR